MTEMESLTMSFAGDLATIVSEIAWEIDDDLSRDVDDRRQAMAVLERYVATYQHRYGVLRLPGNCDGIPLAMVGARVRFWDRLHIRHGTNHHCFPPDHRWPLCAG